ncbi:MAG: hypothetical protein ACREX9_09215 [Gammaproteobacteria bacterium]
MVSRARDKRHGDVRDSREFLAKYLGGRYQEAMTWEVAQRLKEITVDVKTVTLPEKTDAPAGAPKPATD